MATCPAADSMVEVSRALRMTPSRPDTVEPLPTTTSVVLRMKLIDAPPAMAVLPEAAIPAPRLRMVAVERADMSTRPALEVAVAFAMLARVTLPISLVATAAPNAPLPAPAAEPAMDSMVELSVAASVIAPVAVACAPLAMRDSVIVSMSLRDTEPPSAKLPAPVPAAAIDWMVDDEPAVRATPPAVAVAPEPVPSR